MLISERLMTESLWYNWSYDSVNSARCLPCLRHLDMLISECLMVESFWKLSRWVSREISVSYCLNIQWFFMIFPGSILMSQSWRRSDIDNDVYPIVSISNDFSIWDVETFFGQLETEKNRLKVEQTSHFPIGSYGRFEKKMFYKYKYSTAGNERASRRKTASPWKIAAPRPARCWIY